MKKTIALGLLMANVGVAQAAVVYTDAATYDADITSAVIEDFESYALSGSANGGAVTQLDLDHFSVSTVPNAAKIYNQTHFFSQNTTVGGDQFLYLDTDVGFTGSTTTFFDFSAGSVSELGFYYSYNPAWNETLDVTVNGVTYTLDDVDSSGVGFWGIDSDVAITSFSIDSSPISAFGIDDMRLGNSGTTSNVSEPAVASILGLGLVLMGAVRRKK